MCLLALVNRVSNFRLEAEHTAFQSLYNGKQFEQELEQKVLFLRQRDNLLVSLLCISWIFKMARIGSGKSVQPV